jgi:PAS domain S-box-containing protein
MHDPTRPQAPSPPDHPAWREGLELAFEGLALLVGERVVRVNAAFAALLGLAPEALVGTELGDRLIPHDALAAMATLEPGRVVAVQARRADGTAIQVELRRKPLDGATLLSLRELNDQARVSLELASSNLRATAALKASESRYRQLVENAADVVLRMDRAGRFLYANPAAERVAGIPPEHLVGRTYREVGFPPALCDFWDTKLAQVFGGEAMVTSTFELPTPAGVVHLEFRLTPERDATGAVDTVHAVGRDISELNRMGSALRERESQLSTLIANLPGMAYRCRNDAQWTMAFVSEGCLDLTGYAPDDFIDNRRISFDRLYHPEDHARIWDEVQAALAARRPFEVTYRIRDRAGRLKWIWEKGRGIFGDDGALLFLEGLLMDVSATRELADRLARHEAQLQEAQQLARLGSWDWDVASGALSWSDEHYRLLGLAPGAVAPSVALFLSFVHPEDLAAMRRHLTELDYLHERPRIAHDCRLVRADGEVRIMHTRGEAAFDAEGRLSKITGTIQDVTEWRHAEASLRASEARYRLLAESASDMVALFTPSFDYTYASPSAERATGHAPDYLVGTSGLAHVHPDDIARVKSAIAEALAGDGGAKVAYRYHHRDGHYVWLESHGSAILAPGSGEVVGFQVSTRDVSDRVRVETELLAANEALTRLGAIKDEFLSTISHELRTPLAAIHSAVAVLLKDRAGPLSEVQQRFVAMIRDHGSALQRLVDDMLDYQQLKLEDVPARHAPSDLRTLVSAVAAEEAAAIAGRGLTLTLALPETPANCRMDRRQVAQVLRSLLSNAAKFTPAGGQVAVTVAPRGAEVHLIVSDTGRGVPPDALERIFEKFVQVDGSMTRPVGGAGLGLALCKRIVEVGHGGRIWAESTLGVGTAVHVALPADAKEPT